MVGLPRKLINMNVVMKKGRSNDEISKKQFA
jgi:hypothetical protein